MPRKKMFGGIEKTKDFQQKLAKRPKPKTKKPKAMKSQLDTMPISEFVAKRNHKI